MKIYCSNNDSQVDGWELITTKQLKKMPYEDGEVQAIYLCNCFTRRGDIVTILKECKRVLMDGGKIYLSVPSFYTISKMYQGNQVSADTAFELLNGIIVDVPSLKQMLFSAGFRHAGHYDYWKLPHGDKGDFSAKTHRGIHIALNVMAY